MPTARTPRRDRRAGSARSGGASVGDAGETLVAQARGGSQDAWTTLYRAAFPRLFTYARRRLPSEEHARDAVAETMARAVAGIDRYAGRGGGFDAWLSGIHRHVVTDAHRTLCRERPGPVAVPAELVPHDGLGPAERVLDGADQEALRAAFAELGPADQEILELRVVEGMSSDAAAVVLGRSPGAVRMAQARALARLRQLLEGGEHRASA